MSVRVIIESRCIHMIDHVQQQGHRGGALPHCGACRSVRITTVTEALPEWREPEVVCSDPGHRIGAALVEHAEQQASRVRDIEAEWVTWGSGYTKHLPILPKSRAMRCGATAWDPPYPPPTDSTARECRVCRALVNAS